MKNTTKSPKQKASQTILIALAILAALAGLGSFASLPAATTATLAVETWRAVGFVTFAALFGLLAKKPDTNRELWFIVLANKLALTLIGVLYLADGGIYGASDFVIFDGSITVLLIIAGVLQGVWKRKPAR